MANNYQESSSFLSVPKEKVPEAQEIIDRVIAELEDGEDAYCGCSAKAEGLVDNQPCGVWFHGEEAINVEHVERIARELIECLKLDEPFFCSWSFTCSKPRIDEFGGGAFVIKRGYETYWCDARTHVEQQLEHGGLIPLPNAEVRHGADSNYTKGNQP